MVGWFDDPARTAVEELFVETVRTLAATWDLGLRPEDTSVLAVDGFSAVVLMVDVPELVGLSGHTRLHVGWDPPTPDDRGRLDGCWSDDHVLDGSAWFLVDVLVDDPVSAGERAATAIEQQLRRPLERAEWVRGDDVERWAVRLDGGAVLATGGPRRLLRWGVPDRIVRLRGPGTPAA